MLVVKHILHMLRYRVYCENLVSYADQVHTYICLCVNVCLC